MSKAIVLRVLFVSVCRKYSLTVARWPPTSPATRRTSTPRNYTTRRDVTPSPPPASKNRQVASDLPVLAFSDPAGMPGHRLADRQGQVLVLGGAGRPASPRGEVPIVRFHALRRRAAG
ncbi:hypothetical protein GCM10023066_05970 [Nocardioides kongjuensis]